MFFSSSTSTHTVYKTCVITKGVSKVGGEGYQKKTLKCGVRGAERHRGVKREGSVQAKGGFDWRRGEN
jgi:hypothetical protein